VLARATFGRGRIVRLIDEPQRCLSGRECRRTLRPISAAEFGSRDRACGASIGLTEGLTPSADELQRRPRGLLNPMRKGQQMIVHLLNYDYCGAKDAVRPKRNVRVRLKLPCDTAGLWGR